jgi:hypothetical protein
MTTKAVARRSWRTNERYGETTAAHSPDFPYEPLKTRPHCRLMDASSTPRRIE